MMADLDPQWRDGGYAHFPGTYIGAATAGLTCGGCAFICNTKSKYATFHYCRKAEKFAKKRAAQIDPNAPACKYWEERK